jgi:hypothetical protein
MTQPLSNKFNEIYLNNQDLIALINEEFKDLGEKIKSGDYVVVEAKQRSLKAEGAYDLLEVVIKPADENAKIKSIAFEMRTFSNGAPFGTSFRVEKADGDALNYTKVGAINLPFLDEVKKLGEEKVKADNAALAKAAAFIRNLKI